MGKIKANRLALLLTVVMLTSALSIPVSANASNDSTQDARNKLKTETAVKGSDTTATEGAGGEQEVKGDDLSKNEAEKLVRQYVNIPKEYVLQSASYNTSRLFKGTLNVWNFDFSKRVNNKHIGSINATINATTGQLIHYSSYSDSTNAKPSYPLKVDRVEAQKIATDFIGQIAKEYLPKVQFNTTVGVELLPPLSGEVRHVLRYDRVVNGIAYLDNYIQLEINSEGHVLGFGIQWDDTIVFPEVSEKLSLDVAKQRIAEIAEPELRYILPYNSEGNADPLLSYGLEPFAIDAVSGGKQANREHWSYFEGTIADKPLTEKPLGSMPKETKITELQARKIVEEAFVLPANSELQSSSFNEYFDDASGKSISYWNLNWTVKKNGKEIGSISASVNGTTGVIHNYYQYSHNRGEDTSTGSAVTLEKAVNKAVETVKKQVPWLSNELYIIEQNTDRYDKMSPSEIGAYRISFAHKVHGAIVEFDQVSVSINAETGEIQHFDVSISPYSYPEKAPVVIDKAAAIDRWMEYYNTELTYHLEQQFKWNGKPISTEKYYTLVAAGEVKNEEIEQEVDVQLLYRLTPAPRHESLFLDAETGNWRNRETGDVTQLDIPTAKDTAGHWAEQSLQLMVAYKALDLENGNVHPNQVITRGELIKMLVLARSGGRQYGLLSGSSKKELQSSFKDVAADSSYFAYVESALEQNLIDLGDGTFNPEAKVTRDEMSELIVRALGYNTLANNDHIFKANFKDSADIANKGQAAIVVGLKIMNLSDGKFLPKKEVTRAEASVAFFRYLQKRADLQEAPLRM